MDTLFNTNFENFESSHFEPQVKLRAQTYDLQESNVRLRLTVVNTVGFGDQMNKQERWVEECVREEYWQTLKGFNSFQLTHISDLPLMSPCSYQPVVDYIDKQFESYLQEELKIKRSLHNYHDSRVHACLYFISPSGHSLKSLDLVTMKKLDSKVGEGTLCLEGSDMAIITVYQGIEKSSWHDFAHCHTYRHFS